MYYVFELYNLSDQRGEINWSTKRPCRESQPQSLEAFETCDHLSGCPSSIYFIWNGHCCILLVWILLQFKWNIPGRFTRLKKLWPKLSREERRRAGKKHYILFNNYFKPYFVCTTFISRRSWTPKIHIYDIWDTLYRKFHDPLMLNRLIRKQQRQVSKVLLDGLYDPDSPISKLLGVHTEVMGEIIWQKLVEN